MSKKKFEKFDFKTSVDDLEKIDFESVLDVKKPIIFDTNFLFVTFEFKIDIISELQSVIGGTFVASGMNGNMSLFWGLVNTIQILMSRFVP